MSVFVVYNAQYAVNNTKQRSILNYTGFFWQTEATYSSTQKQNYCPEYNVQFTVLVQYTVYILVSGQRPVGGPHLFEYCTFRVSRIWKWNQSRYLEVSTPNIPESQALRCPLGLGKLDPKKERN